MTRESQISGSGVLLHLGHPAGVPPLDGIEVAGTTGEDEVWNWVYSIVTTGLTPNNTKVGTPVTPAKLLLPVRGI